MRENVKYTFPAQLKETVQQFPDKNALALIGEKPITYSELNKNVEVLMAFLQQLGIKKGDKVAILSANMPNWGIVYYAITSLGAIVVPLLPDFHEDEIENILNHSETKMIFISAGLIPKVNGMETGNLKFRIKIEDFSLLNGCPDLPKFNSAAVQITKTIVE